MKKIPALFIRGGTSKGLFFNEQDLPPIGKQRDDLLIAIMGGPDPTGMQLNGMGGGISSTSKVVIISRSDKPDIDVNYLFGQVNLTHAEIDWTGSCGNLAAAVGLYVLHHNIVKPVADGSAIVRVWQVNLQQEITLHLSSPDNIANFISIPGVPGYGAGISVEFKESDTEHSLLPGGNVVHQLSLPGGKKVDATLIFAANPTIFIRAKDIGLNGAELPAEINYDRIKDTFEQLGRAGAAIMQIPYTPAVRVAWLSPPTNYLTNEKVAINREDIDIISRITTEGRVHHAHTGSGAINLACAAHIPGTIPAQILEQNKHKYDKNSAIRIGHPKGVMQVNAHVIWDKTKEKWRMQSGGFLRTAKILMAGDVYL